jgi:gamma-glutamylcyclotransferase (GGCT)/AIG2-like uncharacterized protein YtfP
MLVAVYGTLKKTYPNHRILEVGKAKFVTWRNFPGLMFHMGGYPGVVLAEDVAKEHPCHNFVNSYTIACEVWEVDDKTLLSMDVLEGHPNFYYRTPMKVPDLGEVHIYTQRASKQLHGIKRCISGGFWYGTQTTIMEVQFGDGASKPKILCWRGGTSPKSAPAIVIPPHLKVEAEVAPKQGIELHHNSLLYDDDEFAEAVIEPRNQETEIDLTILDQVKEA